MNIELRKLLLSDAKPFFDILNHPEFHFFPVKAASIKEQRDRLREIKKQSKEGVKHTFAILLNSKVIGGTAITIDQQAPYRCSIGYFIDRKHWGKGIATKVTALLEDFIATNLDIVRIKMITAKGNIGCQKVAIKTGYKREGLMKKYLKIGDKYHDCHLYAKILK